MPHHNYHDRVTRAYLIHMALRNIISPTTDLEEAVQQLEADTQTLEAIKKTRYLQGVLVFQSREIYILPGTMHKLPKTITAFKICFGSLQVASKSYSLSFKIILSFQTTPMSPKSQ